MFVCVWGCVALSMAISDNVVSLSGSHNRWIGAVRVKSIKICATAFIKCAFTIWMQLAPALQSEPLIMQATTGTAYSLREGEFKRSALSGEESKCSDSVARVKYVNFPI